MANVRHVAGETAPCNAPPSSQRSVCVSRLRQGSPRKIQFSAVASNHHQSIKYIQPIFPAAVGRGAIPARETQSYPAYRSYTACDGDKGRVLLCEDRPPSPSPSPPRWARCTSRSRRSRALSLFGLVVCAALNAEVDAPRTGRGLPEFPSGEEDGAERLAARRRAAAASALACCRRWRCLWSQCLMNREIRRLSLVTCVQSAKRAAWLGRGKPQTRTQPLGCAGNA